MITIYDPASPRPLLLAARHEWGANYYQLRSVELGGQPATELAFRRADDARPQVQSCLWLPWRPLVQLEGLTVELFCNLSGAKFFLDCLDGDGWGLRFFLGTDQYEGWHTFRFDPFEIASTWGACAGKRTIREPLQPAALVIEDHDNRGQLEIGLGRITAKGRLDDQQPPNGEVSCTLNRATLQLDLALGERRLVRDFGLRGMMPGTAPADFRRLAVRNVSPVAHGRYQAELAAGEVKLPLEVELAQISSQTWLVRYVLRTRGDLRLERLDLRGVLSYQDVAGLEYAAGEGEVAVLDGQPRAEALLAEPAIWDALYVGRRQGARLRMKADGPVLKTLQLLDLRSEEGIPSYAIDVTIARDETIPAGTELKFNMLFEGKN